MVKTFLTSLTNVSLVGNLASSPKLVGQPSLNLSSSLILFIKCPHSTSTQTISGNWKAPLSIFSWVQKAKRNASICFQNVSLGSPSHVVAWVFGPQAL